MRISGGSSDVCSSDLIANARAALAAAEARVTALGGSGIGQAREALRLAQLSYRAGKSSLIELLDAQQAYASTPAELIAARPARGEAHATLGRQYRTSAVSGKSVSVRVELGGRGIITQKNKY